MKHEIWKPVVGYEGWYEVSNFGRVRRVAPGKSTRPFRVMAKRPCPKGYDVARLHRHGKAHYVKTHLLVLAAFVGPKPNRSSQCNHIDGDKANNRPQNLEWCSPIRNSHHRYDVLGKGSKLNPRRVRLIRRDIARGDRGMHIAPRYGISRATVTNIKKRNTWSHLP